MRILEEALTFDDVLLVPAYSEVLPREVSLASQLTREIGDLRLDPQSAEAALEQHPHFAVEPRNTVNVAPDARGRLWCYLHGEIIAVWALARYNAPPLRRT